MKKKQFTINDIPATLWGTKSDKLFIAVHGDKSHKSDYVIKILADAATSKSYQVLSFDLPEHGDRINESRLCDPQNCIEDLNIVLKYARKYWKIINLFGCSVGAYFSMLAYKDEDISKALFLSPVVDMGRIINNMMVWFDINVERLKEEKEITTPIKTLYWDYYQYVLNNPIRWDKPTALLYGSEDNLCEYDYINDFSIRTCSDMTLFKSGEHFFHTAEQLDFLKNWLDKNIF